METRNRDNGVVVQCGKLQKLKKSKRKAEGERARPQGSLGTFQGGLCHPRSSQVCPGRAIVPQALDQGACASRGRLPKAKTGLQGNLGELQEHRNAEQAEGRSS